MVLSGYTGKVRVLGGDTDSAVRKLGMCTRLFLRWCCFVHRRLADLMLHRQRHLSSSQL